MKDLEFLVKCTPEELEVLADLLREKGGLTSDLEQSSTFSSKADYAKAIAAELLDFGSNTFWFRKDYRTVLEDVCDKLKVRHTDRQSVVQIETNLLGEISGQLWEKASEEGRRALLESMDENAIIMPEAAGAAFAAIFRSGGFASYQLAVIIANSLAKVVLGRGLSLAANAMLTRVLSLASGPLGVLMGLLTVWQVFGPAYRVTVPAVTYVASLRQIAKNRRYARG